MISEVGLESCEARGIRLAYLLDKHVRAEVLQRQLQLLETAVVEGNFDGDGSVRTSVRGVMAGGRHDEKCRSLELWCKSSGARRQTSDQLAETAFDKGRPFL